MSQFTIDTHATVRKFEAAGIETRQAEAIVSAMANSREDLAAKIDLERFATKEDLDALRKEVRTLRGDLERFATKEDLEKFITKEEAKQFATKADLELLRKDMETMQRVLEKQISGAMNKMLIYMFSFATLIIGVLKYL